MLPAQTFVTGEGATPVNVSSLDLELSVVLYVAGKSIKVTDPETGTQVDPRVPLAAAGLRYNGALAIRGYPNEINRGKTNQYSAPMFPAGLYIEPTSTQVKAQLVVPMDVIRARVRDGGTLTVYVNPPAPVTVASGVVYRNGLLTSATEIAADGATWAVYAAPATK